MITTGEYKTPDETYGVILEHRDKNVELLLIKNNMVYSAFKKIGFDEYSYGNKKAKDVFKIINTGLKGCTSKNGSAVPFVKGTAVNHIFKRTKVQYTVQKFCGNISAAEISSDDFYIFINYNEDKNLIPKDIPYIKLTRAESEFRVGDSEEEEVAVRRLEEIALEKDITWLKNKKYYVVNDEATAEKIFQVLDNYKGPISYDTETSGLRINMFGKIGSARKRELEEYNAKQRENGEEEIRVDYLVGIIFCIEKDVAYYFPCANRKFKNLYENVEDSITKRTIDNIKSSYIIGEYRDRQDDMANYIRNTPNNELGSDVILMERCRKIISNGNILAHNGAFEWKVGWLYHIDTNLRDDTMILHQLMYKFRTTTSNRGEPSSLKYLSKVELGVDQLDLKDFFVDFEEDKSKGEIRSRGGKKKSKKPHIDFSYMDYEGSRCYAPADGDLTLQIFFKYKRDLIENHKDLEYLYSVEVLVACAIGYMEFYGHRIDEEKIEEVRENNIMRMMEIEYEIRRDIGYSSEREKEIYEELLQKRKELVGINKELSVLLNKLENSTEDEKDKAKEAVEIKKEELKELRKKSVGLCDDLKAEINGSHNVLNLASPAQVSELFYSRFNLKPDENGKKSVGKKVLKQYLKLKDEDGNLKYPVIVAYSEWKKLDTLVTKFFDNLQYFMYPGGFIFSSYGQISTATGRMSCSKPNAQQYPKDITGIVVPRDGHIILDADFSQIEYRTLVAMANEPGLMEKFLDPDNDYHTMMAALMYGVPYASVTPKMRGDAKSFNFGIPYGMGFGSLAILLTGINNASTREEAKEKYELYFKDQPNVRRFFNDVKEGALVNKFTRTKWGRKRYYSFEDKDGNFSQARRAMALRQAGNAVIQGCLGGDTKIQTKEFGIVKIRDIVGRCLHVWDGDKWTLGDITYSGKKQKCIVNFSNGQSMICSPIHKFLVKSAKGNERFVECKDLKGSINSTNPHRVVINRRYEPSDFKYSSAWAHKYTSKANNANNKFIDSIGNSFNAGVVLGRLASDGSILKRDVGGSCILQYIAEHEINILPELKYYMDKLGCIYADNKVRKDRNEKVNRLYVYSSSLVNEIDSLGIKQQVHDNIFMDTELLRGFLRGLFDGDGGISGKTITLVFGSQHDFEPMCLDIQKALLFFGIRSRYRKYDDRHIIQVKTNDNNKFLDLIGFMNTDKQNAGRQLKCVTDEHIFGPTLVVKSVEITDEYIDMYDVCNTDDGYYVADGVITHNTAADIFKISIARNFTYIRQKGLLGLVLIINMVHDEQLMEINYEQLNVQRVLRDVVHNMEMKIDGFPPLFVGAGIGATWNEAKGAMAEIHPYLAIELSREADNVSVWANSKTTRRQWLDYFSHRVLQFRTQKVTNYILDESNYGVDIHPAIGNLINLQFTYGLEKEYSGDELTKKALAKFIEEHQLDVDPALFSVNAALNAELSIEEEVEYSDEEDEDDLDPSEGFIGGEFALIDEDMSLYGVSLQDIIKQFGLIVSKEKRVCGIDVTIMPYKMKDALVEYIDEHVCDKDDEDAVQVIFLRENNVLFNTGVWVKGISGSVMSTKLGLNSILYR